MLPNLLFHFFRTEGNRIVVNTGDKLNGKKCSNTRYRERKKTLSYYIPFFAFPLSYELFMFKGFLLYMELLIRNFFLSTLQIAISFKISGSAALVLLPLVEQYIVLQLHTWFLSHLNCLRQSQFSPKYNLSRKKTFFAILILSGWLWCVWAKVYGIWKCKLCAFCS